MSTNPPAEYELAGALKELLRLRAELATARAEVNHLRWLNSEENAVRAELATARRERDEARRTVERLRAALEDARLFVSRQYTHRADKLAARIDEALATPSADPVVPHPPAEATARMP